MNENLFKSSCVRIACSLAGLFLLLGCSGSGGGGGSNSNDQKPAPNRAPLVEITTAINAVSVDEILNLSAIVQDDGLPVDNLLLAWHVTVPDNANVDIANAASANTTIVFHEAGQYVVELSVSDSEFTTSRTISVTAIPVNQAPVVDAGPDQNIVLPANEIQLTGTFNDDNLPGQPHTFLWELLSPENANVNIEQPSSLTTRVTFSQSETYTFRLTVNDGEISGDDVVTVVVDAPVPVVGVFPRPSNTSCVAPNLLALPPSKITITPAFPELPHLGEITALKQAPGDFIRWYALQPQGKIIQFDNNSLTSTYSEFLNLQTIVRYDVNSELGLLGMAFHPNYQNNGQVFVHYTTEETVKLKGNNETVRLRSVISRFTRINDVWNEEVLLKVNQPELTNNGGNLDFDQNGYLLVSLGDGGSDNDSLGLAQDTTALLGSILRIDVDSAIPYAIPSDNPYSGNNLCNDPETVNNASACPEIYSYGFRKPNYFSIDVGVNTIWATDSGQNSQAEINILQNGANYGWNIMEGTQCRAGTDPNCDQTGLTLPVYDYTFNNASRSVVGGYVYRGSGITFLYGSYLFADMSSGKIFGSKIQGNDVVTEELLDTGLLIYGFGRSHNGDLYVLNPTPGAAAKGNNIWKIVPDLTGTQPGQVASTLSQTGCVNPLMPNQASDAMISYDVINPLWTDGADKQRYFAIPDNSTINVTDTGDFVFPVGSVLMKHFILNGEYIETRLLMYHPEGWLGYSYEWQYDTSGNPVDAVLLETGKSKPVQNQTWYYPSRGDCLECHTASSGRTIGTEILQLNRDHTFIQNGIHTSNQLLSYEQMGLFSASLQPSLLSNKLVALDDINATYEQRAKSYLHSNCAYCHSPTGPFSLEMDMRYTTPLAGMNLCNVLAMSGDMGLAYPVIINPSGTYDFPESVLPLRMESSLASGFRMPPLGSDIVDTAAVDVVKNWINNLTFCP